MVWSVDALFLQAEMALLDSTPLPNLALKSVFVLLVLAGGLGQMVSGRANRVPRPLFMLWWGFTIYLLIDTGILLLRFGYPTDYVIFSYNVYYFGILLLPLFFYLGQIDESLMARTIVVFFVPLSLIGIAQNLTGAVLLPTESPNGYLKVMSWSFYGSIRGFSLFTSGLNFGQFIAFVGSFGLAFCLARTGKAKGGFLVLLLALTAGYCTLTRTAQLEIACAMLTVWLLYRRPRYRKLISILPILYGILGVFVAFVLPFWIGSFSAANLLSSENLFLRYMGWARYGWFWVGDDFSTFLFGTGLVQNDRFSASADVLVDNTFLAVGLHTGAIGLLFWFAITWCIWKYMLDLCQKSLSPLRAAATASWSVWLVASMFSINVFYLLPFLVLLFTRVSRQGSTVGAREIGVGGKTVLRSFLASEGDSH
jgi:hypothetical protein